MLVLALAGCCGGPTVLAYDAGRGDAGPLADAGTDSDAGHPICGERIEPGATYVVLDGMGEAFGSFDHRSYGPLHESIGVYLPDGVDDGDRVIVTHGIGWPYAGLAVSTSTLEGGRAELSVSGSFSLQEFSVSGTFDVATGRATVHARHNFADAGTDLAELGDADFTMCPVAAALPAPEVRWAAPRAIHPLAALVLSSSVPLAETFAVHVLAGGVEVMATLELGAIVTVTPEAALAPGAPLTLIVTGTDVLGREITLVGATPSVLATTALVGDLSFDTAPEDGARAGDIVWGDGAVHVGETGFPFGIGGSGILAFDAGSATTVRVEVAEGWCASGSDQRLALVAPDGTFTEASGCPVDGAFELAAPASGPLTLVLVNERPPPRPQWGLPPPTIALEVTAITLE
jgi:hypothetical protein